MRHLGVTLILAVLMTSAGFAGSTGATDADRSAVKKVVLAAYVKGVHAEPNPDAMRAHGVSLDEVFSAVRMSNVDVGARTIEINKAEYVIRGLGFIRGVADIESTVVRQSDNVPIRVLDVATVTLGPALRRGALDKGGAEAVGGVVVVRYGDNPLETISNVKEKIAEIAPGLPQKTLPDGRVLFTTGDALPYGAEGRAAAQETVPDSG